MHKPRIRRRFFNRTPGWICAYKSIKGYGLTPQEAYFEWVKRFNLATKLELTFLL